jgi:hypothetical protein
MSDPNYDDNFKALANKLYGNKAKNDAGDDFWKVNPTPDPAPDLSQDATSFVDTDAAQYTGPTKSQFDSIANLVIAPKADEPVAAPSILKPVQTPEPGGIFPDTKPLSSGPAFKAPGYEDEVIGDAKSPFGKSSIFQADVSFSGTGQERLRSPEQEDNLRRNFPDLRRNDAINPDTTDMLLDPFNGKNKRDEKQVAFAPALAIPLVVEAAASAVASAPVWLPDLLIGAGLTGLALKTKSWMDEDDTDAEKNRNLPATRSTDKQGRKGDQPPPPKRPKDDLLLEKADVARQIDEQIRKGNLNLSEAQKQEFRDWAMPIMDNEVHAKGETRRVGGLTPMLKNVVEDWLGQAVDDLEFHTIDKKISRMIRSLKTKKGIAHSTRLNRIKP